MSKIVSQEISWNQETNDLMLVTKYKNGYLYCEPITSEQASLFRAKKGY